MSVAVFHCVNVFYSLLWKFFTIFFADNVLCVNLCRRPPPFFYEPVFFLSEWVIKAQEKWPIKKQYKVMRSNLTNNSFWYLDMVLFFCKTYSTWIGCSVLPLYLTKQICLWCLAMKWRPCQGVFCAPVFRVVVASPKRKIWMFKGSCLFFV